MNLAEMTSARSAVGASALAALAVSALAFARPAEPGPRGVACPPPPVLAGLAPGDIVVVGTAEHDRVVGDLARVAFGCRGTGRVVVYARVVDGRAEDVEAYGRDSRANECVAQATRSIEFQVTEPFAVMIPVDVR